MLIELKVFTCIVDGMCPQQMGYVVSPGLSVFPVARLQGDAVSGPRGLSDPHLELHSLLADALSQTHLIRLHGEVLKITHKLYDRKSASDTIPLLEMLHVV